MQSPYVRIFVIFVALFWVAPQLQAQLTLVEEGGSFAANNLAMEPDAEAFAIDSLVGFEDIHAIPLLNDGVYGNSNSWIGETGLFAGIYLGDVFTVSSIAFGRDNLGALTDRSAGTYTVQYTMEDPVDADTPEEDWTTIGAVTLGDGNCPFQPSLRHRFNFDAVQATALRIIVPNAGLAAGTCIDEIEIYADPGADISPCGGAVLVPAEEGGTFAENNLATGPDAVAFATDVIADPTHAIEELNDGIYGNASSWIGEIGRFAGIFLGGSFNVSSVAFGRDNTGALTDRTLGIYVVQYTAEEVVDENTPDEDWTNLGVIVLQQATCPFRPARRHRYNFDAVQATAIRIVAPIGAAIDEIEIYSDAADDQMPCENPPSPADGLDLVEEGGEIDANNLALNEDAVAFAIDSIACCPVIHAIPNVRDGIYGNSNSWIGETGNFIGIDLGDSFTISSIAFGRDNLGGFTDRSLGSYRVEYTTEVGVDETTEDSAWTAIGTVTYTANLCPTSPWLRHRYNFDPVEATAVRLAGLAPGTCIDELEIYGETIAGSDPCENCSPGIAALPLLSRRDNPVPNADDVPDFAHGQNLARADGATAFGTAAAAGHSVADLNDGRYGDDDSWLGDQAGATSGEIYAGIYFSNGPEDIDQIGFGRDSLGEVNDGRAGCHTVQVTLDEFDFNDEAQVDAANWTTLGQAADHVATTGGALRRIYKFTERMVRAVRIVTASGNAFDEIEMYLTETIDELGPHLDDPTEWGNCMDEENNLAVRAETVPFGTDNLAGFEQIHNIVNINDGIYGNSNSWIGQAIVPGFVGLRLGDTFTIASIAFGRDNGGEAQEFADRSGGLYIFQVTTVENPSETTPSSDWTSVGHVDYNGFFPPDGFPFLRHRYDLPEAVEATGFRIVVPTVGLGGGTCIDEIELYSEPGEEPDENGLRCGEVMPPDCVANPDDPRCPAPCELPGFAVLSATETGGPFSTPAFPFDVPLADDGNLANEDDAIPFATESHPAPAHEIAFLNDTLYGNDNSWLGNANGPVSGLVYAGIAFTNGPRRVGEIALGRDNTGTLIDRAVGCYQIEFSVDDIDYTSDDAVAGATWQPVGLAGDHRLTDPGLRRRYSFPQVQARAIRIVTTLGNAFDEIELYEGEPVVDGTLFRRGDHDGSGNFDITDVLNLLSELFIGNFPTKCEDASDMDNSGVRDVTDALNGLSNLFLGTLDLPPPGPADCGVDPDRVIPAGEIRGLNVEQPNVQLGCEEYPNPDLPGGACP